MAARFRLTDDAERIGEFCARQIGDCTWSDFTGIGLERDGALIAGVVYDSFTGTNVNAHIAGIPGARWMTRTFLYAMFHYPFMQLKVNRITGQVETCNKAALRLNKHFGFQHEATLKGAMPSGDLEILVMWKADCRWLRLGARCE